MSNHDDEQPDDEVSAESAATVTCPYCGETVEMTLDPNGGTIQEYVEDCEVCCRPWLVQVRYDGSGVPTVHVEEA